MLNALMGIGSKGANTSSISISGLLAACKLQEEATNHEKRGNMDKAKECFEAEIYRAEDALQSNLNEFQLIKTRELLAASYFYYGNFLHKHADQFSAEANYKKALEHADYMDLEQPEALELFNQISVQYSSFLAHAVNMSQGNIKQLDPAKMVVEHRPSSKFASMPVEKLRVTLSIQEKSKQVDYLFEKALSTLGSLEVSNKPSLFLVYAHNNPVHGQAEADTSRYLIEKLSAIRVNLYSDQTPMGQPFSRAAEDLKEHGKLEDILTSQLCLLPAPLRKDVEPVGKVAVCCSEVLESYLKWQYYGDFCRALKVAYSQDREQESTLAIREVVRQFSQEKPYKGGFHHVLTEMAFLEIRAEQLKEDHGIIPISLTPKSSKQCLERFIAPTAVRMEDITRFEEQAKAGREVYPNQSRHWVLFKLIERLFVSSDEAQMFLSKFWQGYDDCIKSSTLDALEFAKLGDRIFGDIEKALSNQLILTVQQQQRKELEWKKEPLAILGKNIKEEYFTIWENLVEIQDGLAMYVALECSLINNTEKRFNLEEKVKEFLTSEEKNVLLLLGEAGSGKSTFNRYLARSLWEAYDKETNKSGQIPIPLFIPLSRFKEPNNNLISEYLRKKQLTEIQIANLKENYRFVFILDGYDEIKDRTRLFYVENELDQWKAKVIITSRPEYLGDGYERQFHPKGQAYLLQVYRLAPFSDLTIWEYVNKYKNAYPKLKKNIVEHGEILEQPEVKELVRNPFLLKMALSELPALSQKYKRSGQRITRIALYDQFVESWFERSHDRLRGICLTDAEQKAFDFLNKAFIRHGAKFSKDLAIAMYQAGLVGVTYSEQLSYDQFDVVERDWRDKFLSDRNEQIKLLRFNAPLIYQDDRYRFIHKSIQDYFVARAVWEILENSSGLDSSAGFELLNGIKEVRLFWESLDPCIQVDSSTLFNQFNLVKDLAIQRFLVERVQLNRALVKPLLAWIKASTAEEKVSTAAANAMTILVRAGVPFNGMDLKGIGIPGADLSQGMFDSAQLQKADLRNVNLRTSWLREANLSGAQMAGVEFGEWPYLQEKNQVWSCAYSPDGKTYAVGLYGGTISVYTTSNWEKIYTLQGHTACVVSMAYSPNSKQLASGSSDNAVQLWDVQSGTPGLTLHGHTKPVISVAYSPSGQQLASGSLDNTVRLWDAQSGTPGLTLHGHTDAVWSVVYSPSGEQIASGSSDNTVRLWDAQSGAPGLTLQGHTESVNSVVYSPSGEQIASGSEDCTVRLWDAKGGAPGLTLRGHTGAVRSVVYSPSDQQLASGGNDNTVRLWDAQSGAPDLTLHGHTDTVFSVVYSPSGQQLASGGWDKTVRLWDARSRAPGRTLHGHTDVVNSVVYSPSGEQIASGSEDCTVRLWDVQSGAPGLTLQGHTESVISVAYSPSGEQIASGSLDKTVRLWDAQSGAPGLTLRGHTNTVYSVVYSPSGQKIASGSMDNTVRLWDAQSGVPGFTLRGHTKAVFSVVYSPSGQQIASGSEDCTVRLWDAKGGAPGLTLHGHTKPVISVAYSPSGEQIASGSLDKTVRLWDAQSGVSGHTLHGHTQSVLSVAYSPSGEQIASGGLDNEVRLWKTQTGQCQMIIKDCGLVTSLTWKKTSKDHYLGIGGHDKSVRQWEVKKEGEGYKVNLCWSSTHSFLTVRGTSIEGVQGLSEINKRLLEQRGVVGEPFSRTPFRELGSFSAAELGSPAEESTWLLPQRTVGCVARALFDSFDACRVPNTYYRRGSDASVYSFENQLTLSPRTQRDVSLAPKHWIGDPSVVRLLTKRVQQEVTFKKQLLAIIERSKTDAEVRQAAANAMTILVRAGVPFNGMDLKGIGIPGADLSQGMFDSAQLQKADLRNVNLRTSWLREANLSGAQMAGVEFGEWPYLQEKSQVWSCAYSPDGKTYAVGLYDGTISVYTTSNWEKIYTLQGHTACVVSMTYSPNSKQIASGSSDNTVRLWDAQSGTPSLTLHGHTNPVMSVAYSPSGQQLASGSLDNTVRLWDAQSGAPGLTLHGHTDAVWSVVYSPSGEQIASGSSDNTVRLWDAQSGAPGFTLHGHTNAVVSVVYSPSGEQIASGSEDCTVRLWDAKGGVPGLTLRGHTGAVRSVVYSPSDQQLASGGNDNTVRLWNAQSGAPGHTLHGHTDTVFSVVYSPSGQQLASGGWDKTVRLWDAQSRAPGRTLHGHTDVVNSVVYSPNGEQIASGSSDNTVRLWDAQSGAPGLTLQGHTESVNSVVYSLSGEQIASGSNDKTVQLWDAQSGAPGLTLRGHTNSVFSVAYSPSGEQIASGSMDNTVRLWDARSGVPGFTLRGHTKAVSSVVYSPSGQQIASGSLDNTVRLWDAQSGIPGHTLRGHTGLVFSVVYSPSGEQIASGSLDKTVRLWDAQSGVSGHTLHGHTQSVLSVAYSPSGEQIASGGLDNEVRLWKTQTGQCQMIIKDCGLVTSLTWKKTSKDHYLGIGGHDKSVRQWEVKKEGEGYKVNLCWSSTHSFLTVRGTSIEGVQGLSEINKRLLEQRGVVGEPWRGKSASTPLMHRARQAPSGSVFAWILNKF